MATGQLDARIKVSWWVAAILWSVQKTAWLLVPVFGEDRLIGWSRRVIHKGVKVDFSETP